MSRSYVRWKDTLQPHENQRIVAVYAKGYSIDAVREQTQFVVGGVLLSPSRSAIRGVLVREGTILRPNPRGSFAPVKRETKWK